MRVETFRLWLACILMVIILAYGGKEIGCTELLRSELNMSELPRILYSRRARALRSALSSTRRRRWPGPPHFGRCHHHWIIYYYSSLHHSACPQSPTGCCLRFYSVVTRIIVVCWLLLFAPSPPPSVYCLVSLLVVRNTFGKFAAVQHFLIFFYHLFSFLHVCMLLIDWFFFLFSLPNHFHESPVTTVPSLFTVCI